MTRLFGAIVQTVYVGRHHMLKLKLFAAAAVASLIGTSAALAVGPDLTTLTTAVDFSTVTTAVLAVGASIIGVYLAWKGAKIVISAVKGA